MHACTAKKSTLNHRKHGNMDQSQSKSTHATAAQISENTLKKGTIALHACIKEE
jgi:hypothetical protein